MDPLHGAIEDDGHSSMQIAALVYEYDPGLRPPGASLPENGKELMRPADSLENGLAGLADANLRVLPKHGPEVGRDEDLAAAREIGGSGPRPMQLRGV